MSGDDRGACFQGRRLPLRAAEAIWTAQHRRVRPADRLAQPVVADQPGAHRFPRSSSKNPQFSRYSDERVTSLLLNRSSALRMCPIGGAGARCGFPRWSGLVRIGQLRHVPSADLIAMLDAGGYARYDVRTAERLLELCEVVRDRYDGQVAVIGRRFTAYPDLRAALDALPGWGPVTIRLFLRELRGVWPGADPPLDERALAAARHLEPLVARAGLTDLARLAAACGLDVRDLESGLVRLDLAHGRAMARCPGGQACLALRPTR